MPTSKEGQLNVLARPKLAGGVVTTLSGESCWTRTPESYETILRRGYQAGLRWNLVSLCSC